MLIRVISSILGIAFIALTVWLGYLTSINPTATIIAAFGIAAAIVTPVGFNLITYSVRRADKEKELITQLAKLPEISNLINEAKSQEEKIRILEEQRKNLQEIIVLEAMQLSLSKEREDLQVEATNILERLEVIEELMSKLKMKGEIDKDLRIQLREIRRHLTFSESNNKTSFSSIDYYSSFSDIIFTLILDLLIRSLQYISQIFGGSKRK